MGKLIGAINMTLDGVFDHTAGLPDEDIHQHYTELINQGGVILYGRITFQLMEFWRAFIENPSDDKSMNDFASAIDKIPKIVFSHTLKHTDWESATIASNNLIDTTLQLKKQIDKDILVGSHSLILQLIKLNLIDELQLCIYPVIAGSGLLLFENMNDRLVLELVKTKTFRNGAIILYYKPKIT
jgi:dihydrofolate reductase